MRYEGEGEGRSKKKKDALVVHPSMVLTLSANLTSLHLADAKRAAGGEGDKK